MKKYWADSEIKTIDGKQYMCVYEFGKTPRFMRNVPGLYAKGVDCWVNVKVSEVTRAIVMEWFHSQEKTNEQIHTGNDGV